MQSAHLLPLYFGNRLKKYCLEKSLKSYNKYRSLVQDATRIAIHSAWDSFEPFSRENL